MFLKHLELYGFKSFANRTKVSFTQGVTAVVGPNGSGKSNIIDAIMWALGETSAKQLRGSKMEDIIFSGTGKKSALGFAEVILTFDNNDKYLDIPFEEVSVRRKMFRSGESEFYINTQKVRLKDIRELFMDTGIGKDGYSFIGQGQIDQILSNKPQDRRLIFEEAAGISKYKFKKEESQKNLSKTLENLQRLEDILIEVVDQEKKLKEESQIAKVYLDKKEERDNTYANILIKKESNYREKKNDMSEEYRQIKERLSNALQEKNCIEEDKNTQKIQEQSLREEEDQLQKEKMDFFEKNESIKGKLASNKSICQKIEENRTREEESIILQEEKIQDLEEKTNQLQGSILQVQSLLKGKKVEFESINIEHGILNNDLKSCRKKEKDYNSLEKVWIEKKSSIQSQKDSTEYFIKEKKNRISNLQDQKGTLLKQMEEMVEERGQKQQAIRNWENDLRNIKDEGKTLVYNNSQNQERYQSLEKERKNLENEIENLTRERDFLKRVLDNHEGYSHTVRNFLTFTQKSTDLWEEIIGTVADNISIKEGYETAISLALGASAQNIIIKSDKYVGEMIAILKEKKYGRLTFYPINTMEKKKIDSWVYTSTKVNFTSALELISFEERLYPIFSNLLGRILIVETMEEGKILSRDLGRRFKIVSKNGDLFQIGGSISGGSVRNSQIDLYNRKSEIDSKNLLLEEKKRIWEANQEKLSHTKEIIDRLQSSLLEEENKIHSLEREINKYTNILSNVSSAMSSVDVRIKDIEDEIIHESELLKENHSKLESLNQEYSLLKQDMETRVSSSPSQSLEELELKEKEAYDLLTNKKIEINSIESELREKTNLLEQYKEKQVEITNNIIDSKSNLQKMGQDFDLRKESIEQLSKESHSLEKEIDTRSRKMKEIESKLETCHEKIINLDLREKESYLNVAKLERKDDLITLRIKDMEEKLSKIIAEKKTFFLSHSLPIEESQDSIKTLEDALQTIDQKINSLGPVNENALDEYHIVKERMDFLTHQKTDLFLAKEKLERIIKEIEKEMRSLFKDTISEVQGYFNEIFTKLFNGGYAKVFLEEGEDLLEAGIEIHVQPPGKKLQSLTLLSGGERSMTAVALLFALLKKRISPFCILDEIDAALDEANIKRYTDYLNIMEKMQFIMITHRKTTMEIAEILYGVTMEEEGISKILSMELEEVDKNVGVVKKEVQ